MPREMVTDEAGLYDIHVGWSNSTVQLGLEGREDKKSFWSSLDRNRINRVIRLLRKARDSAYGADA